MNKSLSEQLGSALAHIQDLLDTAFHTLFKIGKNRDDTKSHGKVMKEVGKMGDSFYKTYTDIKSKKK